MIGPTGAVRVMVATKPVDFRKGAEGLATLVREAMMADPFSGVVYVFRPNLQFPSALHCGLVGVCPYMGERTRPQGIRVNVVSPGPTATA